MSELIHEAAGRVGRSLEPFGGLMVVVTLGVVELFILLEILELVLG